MPFLKLNGWFLDDGMLGGTKEDLIRAIQIILEDGPVEGLTMSMEVSMHGCESVPTPESVTPDLLDLNISSITESGFVHLRAPVGSEDFIKQE